MTDPVRAAMLLQAWLSPGFPVGAYAYSHGLEQVIGEGVVQDGADLRDWIATLLRHGALWSDAILFAAAWRGEDVAALARALTPGAERQLETLAQGTAFARTVAAIWPDLAEAGETAYPVACGRAAGRAGIPLSLALPLWLQSAAANLVSAAVRLVPLGQTEGQRVLAALMPEIAAVAREAAEAGLDDLGGAAFLSDIAAMQHETRYTRLFRT